jgi:hypothetical protein
LYPVTAHQIQHGLWSFVKGGSPAIAILNK